MLRPALTSSVSDRGGVRWTLVLHLCPLSNGESQFSSFIFNWLQVDGMEPTSVGNSSSELALISTCKWNLGVGVSHIRQLLLVVRTSRIPRGVQRSLSLGQVSRKPCSSKFGSCVCEEAWQSTIQHDSTRLCAKVTFCWILLKRWFFEEEEGEAALLWSQGLVLTWLT